MIICLIILISCLHSTFVSALPTGAPISACQWIAPDGHQGSSLNLASSPFFLNVSQMTSAGGYSPGQTYTLLLTGGVQQYRGLMVQGRHGTTPVGSFSAETLTQAICSGSSGVTHTSNVLKNNVPLMWTAPPKGTGEVVFSYAVVVQNSEGVSTFYATLTSPTIAELDDNALAATPAKNPASETILGLSGEVTVMSKAEVSLIPQLDTRTSAGRVMSSSLPKPHPASRRAVSCVSGTACIAGFYCPLLSSTCVDGYCRCPDNNDRDYCTCLAKVSGCNIVENLNTSAGVSYFHQIKQTLYSCLNTLQSCEYNVHIIGIYEGEAEYNYFYVAHPNGNVDVILTVDWEIKVPIILVLVSHEPVTWRLSIPAGVIIERVLLSSYYLAATSVTYPSCAVRAVEKVTYNNIPTGYGSDDGGGDTIKLLQYVTQRFGPVSSFSGSYSAGRWTLAIANHTSSDCIKKPESCLSESVCNDGKARACYWGDYCSGTYRSTGTICVDGSCRCPNNPNRDYCTCLAKHAGCNISLDPDHAPGIPFFQGIQRSVYSCSNNNSNSSYSVHIISSYENRQMSGNTPLSISASNLGIKPIVLVLVSYKAANWILNIPQGIIIYKVLLPSHSNVTYASGSITSVERDNLLIQYADGDDEDGGTTLELLQYVTQRFGPVSSFSGSYSVDNWKLNLGFSIPSPAVCPSVNTTPTPSTNISACLKVKSTPLSATTSGSVKTTKAAILISVKTTKAAILTSVKTTKAAILTSVKTTKAAILTSVKTNSESTLTPALTLADTSRSSTALISSAVSSVVVVVLIGVTLIAIKVIRQRKMRVRESNANHTAMPMNSLPSLSTTGHYHTTNGVPHIDQTLVASAGIGAPIHTNTTADMPPPPYSSLPDQPTTCRPLGTYPAAPPAYPASECASV